jgi:(S)-2-hydroxyglutarate dehydrogenase
MPEPTIGIIGGGIIGLALAYKLNRAFPDSKLIVFEKEAEVGAHQSGHNSGVLHAGLYYKPGSLKAQLAIRGIREMIAFCQEHSVPYEQCGKLVVACSEEEIVRLRELLDRGTKNGLRGLRWLKREEMVEIEPHVSGLAAVAVPEEGIADYPRVCRTLKQLIEADGGSVRTSSPVRRLQNLKDGWVITSDSGEDRVDFIFNCAGLQSDRVLALAGERRLTRIVPFRGEYFLLNAEGQRLVRNLIYPVPDPRFPFLGVHFTRMVNGGIEAGPNAVLALAREGYRGKDIVLRDAIDVFAFPGFWKFLARYPSMCTYELWRSFSTAEFCRSLQRLVPEVKREHLIRGGAGVRAQALQADGTPSQDFEFVLRSNALHLINAPSPGATASLAIADYLIQQFTPLLASGSGAAVR